MSSKAPCPTFTQFVLALRVHEQVLLNNQVEKNRQMNYAQAFLVQCARGRGHGGRFQSQGHSLN